MGKTPREKKFMKFRNCPASKSKIQEDEEDSTKKKLMKFRNCPASKSKIQVRSGMFESSVGISKHPAFHVWLDKILPKNCCSPILFLGGPRNCLILKQLVPKLKAMETHCCLRDQTLKLLRICILNQPRTPLHELKPKILSLSSV